jgi:hypothetical protein
MVVLVRHRNGANGTSSHALLGRPPPASGFSHISCFCACPFVSDESEVEDRLSSLRKQLNLSSKHIFLMKTFEMKLSLKKYVHQRLLVTFNTIVIELLYDAGVYCR